MDLLAIPVWIIIVYVIIRNIPLKCIWIILISILIAFFQWFIVVFYENKVNDWTRPFPTIITAIIQLIHLFIALILAIVIRKYFAYQKNKRTEISNKSSEQTKA